MRVKEERKEGAGESLGLNSSTETFDVNGGQRESKTSRALLVRTSGQYRHDGMREDTHRIPASEVS